MALPSGTVAIESIGQPRANTQFRVSRYQICLLALFLLSLPLCNPWVRGDGVGYYAYVRALVIEKHLDFRKDWEHGNESFVMSRLDSARHPLPSQYTSTGMSRTYGPSVLPSCGSLSLV